MEIQNVIGADIMMQLDDVISSKITGIFHTNAVQCDLNNSKGKD